MKKFLKKIIVLSLLIAASSAAATAQCPKPSKEDMEKRLAAETAYMMRTLGIKSGSKIGDEFTEVYKNYRNEMNRTTDNPALIEPTVKDGKKQPLTDDQIDANNKARFAHGKKMIAVREKYYDRFRKFLSAKEMDEFYKRERDLIEKARKEMHRRKSGHSSKHQPHKKSR